jgi:hypothetical protein
MGHSCQALALLVKVGASFQAVPLTARIHEGLVFSNRDRRTLLDKLLLLLAALQLPEPVLLVADAYYACGKIIAGLIDQGGHLISRLKKNACAYTVPPGPRRAGRGRPRLYGTKIRLRDLFTGPLATMPSPVYDEHNVTLRWTCCDLLWRPAGRLVRFGAVVHPHRGQILLLSTDKSAVYRTAIRRKLDAYHRHIQIGLVAQGLLQCLAALHPALVWRHFGSWLRTVRSPHCPSEFVVACALRHSLPEFLAASPQGSSFELFLRQRLDLQRIEGSCLAAYTETTSETGTLKKGSIRICDHDKPPSSASRIAWTSPSVNTFWPQTARNCPAKSIFTGLLGAAAAGVKRAKRRPRLIISTDSPFSSHADTRRKLLRRSATVAVLLVMIE